MSDLRAKVEGLPPFSLYEDGQFKELLRRESVRALIPEGAVLVTEETLAAALIQTGMYVDAGDPLVGLDSPKVYAAAILRHLREGT